MPSGLRTVTTGDGSVTVFSDEFGQTMHSSSGAYDEALRKHVIPSRLTDHFSGPVRVLDVGFGLGYNILALLNTFRLGKIPSRIEIISLEKDRSAEDTLYSINFGDERDVIFQNIRKAFHDGSFKWDNISLTVIFGDARQALKDLPADGSFHAVFHDPFSPSKNPELWTLEFFIMLYDRMKDGAVLTTYSAAPQVRGAMLAAGFSLLRGSSVGGKREGTIAVKNAIRNDADGIAAELEGNYKSVPYRDGSLDLCREEILSKRIDEMAEVRARGGRPVRPV